MSFDLGKIGQNILQQVFHQRETPVAAKPAETQAPQTVKPADQFDAAGTARAANPTPSDAQLLPMMNEAFGIEDYQPVPARVAEIKTHEPEHMVNAWKELTADGSLSKADAAKLDRKMGDVRIFGHNFKDGMDTLEAKFIAARLADPSVNIDPNVRQSYEQRLAARQERMESGEVMSGTFLHGDRIHELTEGHVNVPFEQFIDLMPADRWAVNLSDYRGGEVKITETDSQGRVVRQEERMVTETPFSKIFPKLFEPNDMTKVEVIDYQNDKITVQWEVLDSVNRTTLMDIGSLTFMRDGDGTKIQLESEHVIDAFPGALDTIEHIPVAHRGYNELTATVMRNYFSDCIERYQKIGRGEIPAR